MKSLRPSLACRYREPVPLLTVGYTIVDGGYAIGSGDGRSPSHTPLLFSSDPFPDPTNSSIARVLISTAMKVHPAPNRRNITVRYDFGSPSSASAAANCRQKKLRRLPHIFAKVLELPFYADAEVSIEETSDSLIFVVDTDDGIGTDIAAHTIEICPGVTKVVVRGGGGGGSGGGGGGGEEVEVDLWRFRLPETTQPELATAAFSDGELVVRVPKEVNVGRNREGVWGNGNGNGNGSGRLVLGRA
ncbi:hypothetical protein OSB04_022964 [Centaurea solstitialis]|uniref:SHSP domain-containing protein n=1 Tax=Centaurea solstitialis TaxID=347529 RepID=A0AA38W1U5_9ASTR|nr:hypothetical protein OSB04_022964 [Centaurea solstitialis]